MYLWYSKSMIQSDLLSVIPGLVHGYSDRSDGNMSIKASEIQSKLTGDFRDETQANRQRFLETLGVRPDQVVLSRQTHQTIVEQVTADHHGLMLTNGSPFASADGLFTQLPATFLAIFSADCLPIFLVDPITRTVAGIHAGWRGIAGNIIARAVEALVKVGVDPANLLVWIGPHIQSCHYRLDQESPSYDEKLSAFRNMPQAIIQRGGDSFLDLTGLAVRQLEEQGIAANHIDIGMCTACRPEQFFSYYMDKGNVSGIMMGLIGWKGEL